jgi:hypothetical protein
MPLTIPRVYPHGFPRYWRDEASGVLAAAMNAYLDHRIDGAPLTREQFALVKDYLIYYVDAPVWQYPEAEREYKAALLQLRFEAYLIQNVDDAVNLLEHCLDLGLDPL